MAEKNPMEQRLAEVKADTHESWLTTLRYMVRACQENPAAIEAALKDAHSMGYNSGLVDGSEAGTLGAMALVRSPTGYKG
jgi:ABC-type uncharacterized transport system permease subunit